MSGVVSLMCFGGFVAGAWGLVRPYKNIARGWFAILAVGFFVALTFGPPRLPDNAARANAPTAASSVAAGQHAILAKVAEASGAWAGYSRKGDPMVFKAVGPDAFRTLAKLEPGAYYAAAESNSCNKVASGTVSPDKSTRGRPVWFVDCDNGNRFIISSDEAAAALARMKAGRLVPSTLAEGCSADDLQACLQSDAQKSASEAEVVAACDAAVKQALVGDSRMDWTWDYGFGEGDRIEVARGFKAENAFGAKLRSRYSCEFDAGTGAITKLEVEGPFGIHRLI